MTQIPDLLILFVAALALMAGSLTLTIMVSWLVSRFASKMVLPTVQCRNASNSLAVKAAVDGISSCAPEASNIAVTLSACASENTIWLAFINQIKVAFCYLLGLSTDTQADILAIQDDITAIDAEIVVIQDDITAIEAQLPSAHTGTPTISAGAAAGGSPTITLLAGSTDTQGAVDVTLGSAPTAAGGSMFTIQFGTAFAAQIFPVVSARVGGALTAAGLLVNTFESGTAPVTACLIVVHSPTSAFLAAQTFRVSYHIGFTS